MDDFSRDSKAKDSFPVIGCFLLGGGFLILGGAMTLSYLRDGNPSDLPLLLPFLLLSFGLAALFLWSGVVIVRRRPQSANACRAIKAAAWVLIALLVLDIAADILLATRPRPDPAAPVRAIISLSLIILLGIWIPSVARFEKRAAKYRNRE